MYAILPSSRHLPPDDAGPLALAFGVECVAFASTPGKDADYPDIQFLLSTLNPTTNEAEYLALQIGLSREASPFLELTLRATRLSCANDA